MIGTAHGRAGSCRMFADTRLAHGTVPAAATVKPVRIERSTMGRRSQNRLMVI